MQFGNLIDEESIVGALSNWEWNKSDLRIEKNEKSTV